MGAEVVCVDLGFAEGPAVLPDGALALVSVDRGLVYRIDLDAGSASVLARTNGGPNAAAATADGGVVVTQNGGFDFIAAGLLAENPTVPAVEPGLQMASAAGEVRYLARGGFSAPNDLAVGLDGAVYFTDPVFPPSPETRAGRVWRHLATGETELFATGFRFCNGVTLEPTGALAVVEGRGLMRLFPDGSREWIVQDLGPGGGDGLCADVDGRLYVAATVSHGVRVIEGGREVDFLALSGHGLTTNCCFGGADGRTLLVTDGLPGQLLAFESMPSPGAVVRPCPSAL